MESPVRNSMIGARISSLKTGMGMAMAESDGTEEEEEEVEESEEEEEEKEEEAGEGSGRGLLAESVVLASTASATVEAGRISGLYGSIESSTVTSEDSIGRGF